MTIVLRNASTDASRSPCAVSLVSLSAWCRAASLAGRAQVVPHLPPGATAAVSLSLEMPWSLATGGSSEAATRVRLTATASLLRAVAANDDAAADAGGSVEPFAEHVGTIALAPTDWACGGAGSWAVGSSSNSGGSRCDSGTDDGLGMSSGNQHAHAFEHLDLLLLAPAAATARRALLGDPDGVDLSRLPAALARRGIMSAAPVATTSPVALRYSGSATTAAAGNAAAAAAAAAADGALSSVTGTASRAARAVCLEIAHLGLGPAGGGALQAAEWRLVGADEPRLQVLLGSLAALLPDGVTAVPSPLSDDARTRLGLLLAGLRAELDLLARWEWCGRHDEKQPMLFDDFDETTPSPQDDDARLDLRQLSASQLARALVAAQSQSDGHCAAVLERDATCHQFARLLEG